jgi:hypothetical protein
MHYDPSKGDGTNDAAENPSRLESSATMLLELLISV